MANAIENNRAESRLVSSYLHRPLIFQPAGPLRSQRERERERGTHTNRRTQHRVSARSREDYDDDDDDEDEECCSVAIVAQETSGRYSCTALGTA